MTVTLSVDAILERIYASTALYAVMNPKDERPPVLSRENRSALVAVVQSAFAFQILDMVDIVTAQSSDDVNLTAELIKPKAKIGSSVSELLAACVTARALHAIWLQYDSERAKMYQSMTQQSTSLLCETFLYIPYTPGLFIESSFN